MTHRTTPRIVRRLWILLPALIVGSVGCVSQSAHDKLLTAYRRGQEQLVELKTRLDEAQARINALLEAPPKPDPELLGRLATATAERDRLAKVLDDAEARLRELSQQKPILPPALDDALEQLTKSHADLMSYDPARGMVKLKSDLTFALGSAVVSENGATTIRDFAKILNTPVALPYDTRIVGHTDTVPIGRAETRRLHPTNWHLSVHRSIAVKDAIEEAGVKPRRIMVAGRGEHHPVVPNGPKGAEANRRVEIFLVRSNISPSSEPVESQAEVPASADGPVDLKVVK